MARKRSRVEWCLCRLLCAGFLGFALLAVAAPSGAADECDRTAEEPCSFLGQYASAPEKCCVWDDYDSKQAGHPLRIAAYVLHPVGVIIDWVIFRPAWWVGSHEPFYTLFGRTD